MKTLDTAISLMLIFALFVAVGTMDYQDAKRIEACHAVKPAPRIHDAEWSKLYADANRIMPPRYQVPVK